MSPLEDRWLDDEAGPVVRPYALTRGRTRPSGENLDMIAMVIAVRGAWPDPADLEPEHFALLRLCAVPASVADLAADLDLPLEHEIQTYHIVREALSNIAKHSSASHARLIVDHLCGYYVFTIEDNGVGTFSPLEGHYGIIIMRERAQRIGGEIKVESTKGLGTCVQLFFPEPELNWRSAHG